MEEEEKTREKIGSETLRAWHHMGAHIEERDGVPGYGFAVWAPAAAGVSVVGDFNGWDERNAPLQKEAGGLWSGFLPGLERYENYKFAIATKDGRLLLKADPYAFHAETRPGTASKLYDLSGYSWGDENWLRYRSKNPVYHRPLNIYELHLGSWRRTGDGEMLSYRDITKWLVPYIKKMGFTHVELLPVTEHPLDASWGYQCTGYFAATSRFGTPHDFMYLVDQLHRSGIGVILDWVPAHFPRDAFGLFEFDGGPCYEYADPRKGEHLSWGTKVFDYGKEEVRAFLRSSALFWLEEYHIDGLRVDAVASMLYLDYGRENGAWVPNRLGGRENLEAADFLKGLNEAVFADHPDVLMIAEESTSWPLVTRPTDVGGLGFNLKWNMGWMNDLCHYMKLDAYFRQFNHNDITFSLMYAFSENFVLPLSHDEVVYMKGSLIGKMPGSEREKYAGVRVFYTYMMTHPGKKLLFMGSEFGQEAEWNFEQSLDWHLLEREPHRQLQTFFQAAGAFYLEHSELWEEDFDWKGFRWLCSDDKNGNTAAFLRMDTAGNSLAVICNFSPVHRKGYRLGLPFAGEYRELFNTDDPAFGGGGFLNPGPLSSQPVPCHGMDQSMEIDLPPLAAAIFRCTRRNPAKKQVKPPQGGTQKDIETDGSAPPAEKTQR